MKLSIILAVHVAVIAALFLVEEPIERAYHNFLRGAKKYDLVASGTFRGEPGMTVAVRVATNDTMSAEQTLVVGAGDRFDFQHARKRTRTGLEKLVVRLIDNDFWAFFEQLGLIWWGMLCCIFLWIYDPPRRRQVILFFAGAVLMGTIVTILKSMTGKIRPEPFFENPLLYPQRFLPFMQGWSLDAPLCFPSGHSTHVFLTATLFAILYPRAAWMFYAMATITALSRTVTEAHWLSDIYAGAVLGTYSMRLMSRLFETYITPLLRRLPAPIRSLLRV